jgi:hypothetical protein
MLAAAAAPERIRIPACGRLAGCAGQPSLARRQPPSVPWPRQLSTAVGKHGHTVDNCRLKHLSLSAFICGKNKYYKILSATQKSHVQIKCTFGAFIYVFCAYFGAHTYRHKRTSREGWRRRMRTESIKALLPTPDKILRLIDESL